MIEKVLIPKSPDEICKAINNQDIYQEKRTHNNIIQFIKGGYSSNLNRVIVKSFLEQYSYSNSYFTSKIFSMLCKNNELEFVKIMLNHYNFDPTEHNNIALKLAYHNDAYEVIDYLLHNKRISSLLTQCELLELQDYLSSVLE